MRAHTGVAILFCLAVPLAAQGPSVSSAADPAPPPPQSVNAVQFDVHASRDGEPVNDLSVDDFEVIEDGERQQVTSFTAVHVADSVPDASTSADFQRRVFVVFLDTTQLPTRLLPSLRLPALRFVDRLVGNDDLLAVMTPDQPASAVEFGQKASVLSALMARDTLWANDGQPSSLDEKDALYARCYADRPQIVTEMQERRRERLGLESLDDLVLRLGEARRERVTVIIISDGWRLFRPNRALMAPRPENNERRLNPFGRNRRDDRDDPRPASGTDQTECDADRQVLSEMDGLAAMRTITDAANRTSVSFYPVAPAALLTDRAPEAASRDADATGARSRIDSLRTIAEDTDGVAVLAAADVDAQIVRVRKDASVYYLLGYSSTNAKLDGKYRDVTVRVRRPGVQVRARRGYRGLTAEEVLAMTDGPSTGTNAARRSTASLSVTNRAPFRMRAASWASAAAGGTGTVWLVGEMDFATRRDLAWTTGATAEVSVVAATGSAVQTTTLTVPSGEGGFSFTMPALTPGEYAVRVKLTPELGTAALPLTDLIRVTVPDMPTAIGEAVMSRRGPSTGLRHVLTADPRFQRNERLRLELPTALPDAATARLLDRSGTPLRVPVTLSERPDPDGFRWITADVTLAPLAAGDYSIEVIVGKYSQLTPFRLVP